MKKVKEKQLCEQCNRPKSAVIHQRGWIKGMWLGDGGHSFKLKEKHEDGKFSWTWEIRGWKGEVLPTPMIQFHGPGIGDTSMFLGLSKSHADMMLMYFSKIYQQALWDVERKQVSKCVHCAGDIRVCIENNRGWKIMQVEPPAKAHCAKGEKCPTCKGSGSETGLGASWCKKCKVYFGGGKIIPASSL